MPLDTLTSSQYSSLKWLDIWVDYSEHRTVYLGGGDWEEVESVQLDHARLFELYPALKSVKFHPTWDPKVEHDKQMPSKIIAELKVGPEDKKRGKEDIIVLFAPRPQSQREVFDMMRDWYGTSYQMLATKF